MYKDSTVLQVVSQLITNLFSFSFFHFNFCFLLIISNYYAGHLVKSFKSLFDGDLTGRKIYPCTPQGWLMNNLFLFLDPKWKGARLMRSWTSPKAHSRPCWSWSTLPTWASSKSVMILSRSFELYKVCLNSTLSNDFCLYETIK